jgi:hypothetical protein
MTAWYLSITYVKLLANLASMPSMAVNNAAEVFVYTGVGEGAVVPEDVVRVRIDPSVLSIPEYIFSQQYKLETIELHAAQIYSAILHTKQLATMVYRPCLIHHDGRHPEWAPRRAALPISSADSG